MTLGQTSWRLELTKFTKKEPPTRKRLIRNMRNKIEKNPHRKKTLMQLNSPQVKQPYLIGASPLVRRHKINEFKTVKHTTTDWRTHRSEEPQQDGDALLGQRVQEHAALAAEKLGDKWRRSAPACSPDPSYSCNRNPSTNSKIQEQRLDETGERRRQRWTNPRRSGGIDGKEEFSRRLPFSPDRLRSLAQILGLFSSTPHTIF